MILFREVHKCDKTIIKNKAMIIPKFRIVVISSLEGGVLWAFGNVFLTYMVVTGVFVLQSSVQLTFIF